MKNRPKLNLVLLLGLISLLAILLASCGEPYTKDDLSDGYQQGYDTGFDIGYEKGHDAGYDEGYDVGYADAVAQYKPAQNGAYGENGGEKGLSDDAIWWYEAKDHIGDRLTVCGLVVGTKYGATSIGQPTWLNIGNDYPNPERFVVIIWGENRGSFPQLPESYYLGENICVTGLIQEYQGIPQIEARAPNQIQDP